MRSVVFVRSAALAAALMSMACSDGTGQAMQSDAGQGQAGAGSREFIPSSIGEALRELRHSAAAGADWRRFGITASATHRTRGHFDTASVDGQTTTELADVDVRGASLFSIASTGGSSRTRAPFEDATFDASKATSAGKETITIAGRSYEAEKFVFSREYEIQRGESRQDVFRYWLVAGIPKGIARRDWNRIAVTGGQEQVVFTSTRRLTDVDVPFRVGNRVLRSYCFTDEKHTYDNDVEKSRECWNSGVPGGLVRDEYSLVRKGRVDSAWVKELVEFEVH